METDACAAQKSVFTEVISKLQLDEADTISVLFLLNFNENNALKKVLRAFYESRKCQNFWQEYLINISNWQNKLFEALILIQNISFFKVHMKYTSLEISNFTNYRYVPTRFINNIAKDLYMLCEMLHTTLAEELLNEIYSENGRNINIKYLECHILYWMKIGFIKIYEIDSGQRGNFSALLKILKKLNLYDSIPYINLSKAHMESCRTDFEKKDYILPLNNNNNIQMSSETLKNNNLCIIINEEKYDTQNLYREGSDLDTKNLYKTFTGCNFEVIIHNNLDHNSFNKMITEIPVKYKDKYNSIVLCILSHGELGCIQTCDEKSVELNNIQRKLCQIELKDTIKIVIVQACQGYHLGVKNKRESLTTDSGFISHKSPTENVEKYANFFLWQATLDNFKAIRDPKSGTWFINELCSVIQTEQERRSLDDIFLIVNDKLSKKEGNIDGEIVGQLAKNVSSLTKKFYFPPFKQEMLDNS